VLDKLNSGVVIMC